MDNFNNALNALNSLSKDYEIFVPSLNKKLKFKDVTTKQQKNIVKCALEEGTAGLSFINLTSEIVRDNCNEPSLLLASDKNFILTSLRALSISPSFKPYDTDTTVDLMVLVNKNIATPDILKTREVTDGTVSISAAIPTIAEDIAINNETKKKLLPITNTRDLTREALGEMYINEIIKYMKTVKVGTEEIKFSELTFNQKTQIVEKIPISLNAKLIDYINSVKQFERELLTLPDSKTVITVEPTFFTV